MTLRELIISLGFNIDRNSEQRAEQGVKNLKNTATKLLGAIGLTISVAGIAKGIASCVTLSSEVEEMQNKFDVVFSGMTDTVEEWAQTYADAIGRNSNDIKNYLADTQNLLVGMGMQREAGAELSEQMLQLAFDLSSFNNIDEATAVNAMTKALMGESESAKTLGAVLNDNTRAQAMQTLGLSGTYQALDEVTKMQVNYQAILAQSTDAIGDCERSMGSYRSTLTVFQSKLKELKTLIGQFFMPTFQKVLSFGSKGLILLRNGMQRLNEFAAKVGGADKILSTLAVTLAALFVILNFKKLQQGLSMVGSLLGKINLKVFAIIAIVLVLVLLIQDFIAFMKGDNSVIGALFDKAGIGADNARETIINAWNTVKTFLLNVWDAIKRAATVIFGALSDWWAENGEGVKESFAKIWEGIKSLCETLWNALSAAAQTIFNALKQFWDTWGETIMTVFGIIWDTLISLIQPFLDALAALIDFLANVFTGNWEGAWQAIKDFAAAIWEMITNIITGAWDIICSIWSKLSEIFSGIFDAAKNAIVERVTAIKDSIVNGFTAAIDWIKSLPEQALQWGADIIQGIVDGIMGAIDKVKDAIGNVASKIKSFLGFSEPEDGPLSDFHTYMPDMIDLMAQGIQAGKKKVVDALSGVTGEMSVAAKANIVSPDTISKAGGGSSVSKSITQNVEINNQFNGDRAGQEKSSAAMDKAAGDATSEMARAIAFAR